MNDTEVCRSEKERIEREGSGRFGEMGNGRETDSVAGESGVRGKMEGARSGDVCVCVCV